MEASSGLVPGFTGIQRYIYELTHALHDMHDENLHCRLLVRLGDYRKRRYMPAYPWPVRWYLPGSRPLMPGCDILHGLSVRIPPTLQRVRRISTLHDLFGLTLPNYGSKRTLRKYEQAARRADRIIAVSHATKNDFLNYYRFPENRIDVVYHGVSRVFMAPQSIVKKAGDNSKTSDAPYFVVFGGSPRKNLGRLIRAFRSSAFYGHALLRIVGSMGPEDLEAIKRCGMEKYCVLEGRPDDGTMASLYRGSAGLIFPSLQEGFGIPVLEAMACGVPVVTGSRAGTAEVAGGHAVLVDPDSVDAIKHGIDAISSVTVDALVAAAAYARQFTWKRTAEQTLAVYRAVM